MRSLLLLFLCFTLSYAKQSKQCELSSDRCIVSDFQPDADDRVCGDSDERFDKPNLKQCNDFFLNWEECTAPTADEIAKFFCNKVIDADNNGPVRTACEKWEETKYCKPLPSNTWVPAIIFVALLVLACVGIHYGCK